MSGNRISALDDDTLLAEFRATRGGLLFDELQQRHERRIYARCLCVLRNPAEAEDAVQETFLRVLVHIGSYQPGNFSGWVSTIARNICLNRLRSSGQRAERPLDESPEAGIAMTAEPVDPRHAERFLQVIKDLPEKQAVCLKLFYLQECSYEETARIAGLTLKEVKTHIQNGRRMLRKRLGHE